MNIVEQARIIAFIVVEKSINFWDNQSIVNKFIMIFISLFIIAHCIIKIFF